ncbi:alpha/beta fold hydrolase [Sphingomonas crusticola]|uniref:alpha/beta fold hydrolase n=1 Tax=Sphingomonas crusticola TaxID=1697973 RepID=UPI000E284AF1|nr:alpha/beta hydrolase [Sphingomonas crusticola]
MPTIKTDLLEIDYRDEGPVEAPAVLLLHGWPDDASTWDAVGQRLNEAGFRTIAPSLRGFGNTRFLSPETPRTGNAAVLALDTMVMMDRLGIVRFFVAGHDWGSNVAEALAVGWPNRVARLAMLSSPPRLGGVATPPFWHARLLWYQWFQATQLGADAVREDPKGFARTMWENWSPAGWFDDALFDRVAQSFENPDWAEITIHSYRARWGETAVDPRSEWLEENVRKAKTLTLPFLYIQGEADGVDPPSVSANIAAKFTGPFERIVLPGVGHFPTREAPQEVASRLIALYSSTTLTEV